MTTKKRLRAVEYYGRFDVNEEKTVLVKNYKLGITTLKNKQKLHNRVKRIKFGCPIRYSVFLNTINFYAPEGGWESDRQYHLTLAKLVKEFEVKFERRFSSYSGTYYWTAKTKKGLMVDLNDAIKPDNCIIVPVSKVVTEYQSVCGEEAEKLRAKS